MIYLQFNTNLSTITGVLEETGVCIYETQITACQRTENNRDNVARCALMVLSTWRMISAVASFLALWAHNQMTACNTNYELNI